jgi:hypothetical protein
MTTPNLVYSSINFNSGVDPLFDKFQHIHKCGIYYEQYVPFPRAGTGPNPWNLAIMPEHKIPWIADSYNCNFEETTDCRAKELAEIIKCNDLPVVFFWSGGIDSTVSLCGMIRNWDAELINRVTVKMNFASYFENPWFFDHHIQGKIKFNDDPISYGKCMLIDGGMADPLWIQRDIISMDLWNPGIIKNNVIQQPDELLSWLVVKCGQEHAHWFYEMVIENSISAGIELQDYEDFYWWWNFNYCYACQQYKSLGYVDLDNTTQIDMQEYFSHVMPWYSGKGYQQWSMSNRSNGVKYQGTVRSYKETAKDYIFSVDHNPWYKDYKTKMASPGFNHSNEILSIYNNGKFLLTK